MSLFFKLGAATAAILCFSIALIVLLNYAKFETTLGELQRSRLRVLALDAKASTEAAIDLGLALPAARDAQQIVTRVSDMDPDIRGVVILDRRGTVLFQSGLHATTHLPGSARERAVWFEEAAASRDGTWNRTDSTALLVGAPILNPFSQPVGFVLIAYDRRALDARASAFLHTFARQALWPLGCGFTLVCALMWGLLKPMGQRFQAMEKTFRGMEGPEHTAPADEELRAFDARYRDASQALTRAEKSLEGT
ncbi:cache domain-containing protein [Corallococcus macrosporus]|uniref:Cache domain-containing protein n=1 Tax=Corallococcus macrosporus TaxID=35 RepID=A0ABS3DLX7_9BACT|nr:cache domain-containing protein [Corallococcus macrosporus]MBN8232318.1 cache domain-containing protein [Corallococcus macrosporus]